MIGKNVTKYREELSISQRELARRVGLSGQMISKIENDLTNPSLDTLSKIADILGCTILELTTDTESDGGIKIGYKIRKYRKGKMTQKELAERLNKSLSLVKKYESGNALPALDVLNRIATALGVSVNDLIKGDVIDISNKKSLSDYSTDELLEEIRRRCFSENS